MLLPLMLTQIAAAAGGAERAVTAMAQWAGLDSGGNAQLTEICGRQMMHGVTPIVCDGLCVYHFICLRN